MDINLTKERSRIQEQHRIELLREALSGETKLDTLPNTALPLHGEVEAMYFESTRSFFRNNISSYIMEGKPDVFEGM